MLLCQQSDRSFSTHDRMLRRAETLAAKCMNPSRCFSVGCLGYHLARRMVWTPRSRRSIGLWFDQKWQG
jgi:hypothetical protein